MSRKQPLQAKRFFDALIAAGGKPVSHEDLRRAIYPRPDDEPASAAQANQRLARVLREHGIAVRYEPQMGFWIDGPLDRLVFPPPPAPKPPRQAERMLQALRGAHGRTVSVSALADALYPPGVPRPASADATPKSVARLLREMHHDVVYEPGAGYRLAESPR